MNARDQAITAQTLVELIRPILAGHPPMVQGAALADCLSIWLAGHNVPDDADATHDLRAVLLENHCAVVRQLTPISAKQLGTTP